MARIKFTALVESIRGSIAGTTFQRNAYGYTVKAKPNMVNPNSHYQSQRKQQFQAAQLAWQTLTDAERGYWNSYAATYPTPSINNPSSYLSGYNLFTRWHAIEFLGGSTILTNPSGAQGNLVMNEFNIYSNVGLLDRVITFLAFSEAWTLYEFYSLPLSPTKVYNKSFTRLVNGQNASSPMGDDIRVSYESRFNYYPQPGDILAVDLTFKRTDNAQVVYIPSFLCTVEV